MPLRSTINCGIAAEYTGPALISGSGAKLAFDSQAPIKMESGVAADRADKLFAAEYTIAASGNQALDLNGVLTYAFGAVFSPAKIRAVMIEADAANTNNVEVGGAAANGFLGWFKDATDILVLSPGDRIVLSSRNVGKTVTAATADQLKLANSGAGTSVTVRIVLLGTSS